MKTKTERADTLMPTSVTPDVSLFDRFATKASEFVSKSWFFTACVLMIAIWAPTVLFIGSVDTWQLLINTATTIITFLLVALLQNSQKRADQAIQHKLNAIAKAMTDLSIVVDDIEELKAAIGLEDRESS